MARTYSNLILALPLVFGAAALKADGVSDADMAIADRQIDTPVEISALPKEAWDMADDYALEHPVVAIALYGPENDPRVGQAQALLEGWFQQRNIPTQTFIGVHRKGGFTAGYYVKGLQFGPTVVHASVAIPKMEQAANMYPGAWPDVAQVNEPVLEDGYALAAN